VKREVAQLLEDVRALARMAEEEKRHYCGLRGGGERRLMLPHPSTFHCEEKHLLMWMVPPRRAD